VTHSIIDAINPVLHTPEGAIVYGLDKRMDHTPVIGDPIDMKVFREIGREGWKQSRRANTTFPQAKQSWCHGRKWSRGLPDRREGNRTTRRRANGVSEPAR
jgi:hypothetical protein